MASMVPGAPQPIQGSTHPTYLPEKQMAGAVGMAGIGNDPGEGEGDDKADPLEDSEHKQQGVQQVEAITTVWSRELLIVMFIL